MPVLRVSFAVRASVNVPQVTLTATISALIHSSRVTTVDPAEMLARKAQCATRASVRSAPVQRGKCAGVTAVPPPLTAVVVRPSLVSIFESRTSTAVNVGTPVRLVTCAVVALVSKLSATPTTAVHAVENVHPAKAAATVSVSILRKINSTAAPAGSGVERGKSVATGPAPTSALPPVTAGLVGLFAEPAKAAAMAAVSTTKMTGSIVDFVESLVLRAKVAATAPAKTSALLRYTANHAATHALSTASLEFLGAAVAHAPTCIPVRATAVAVATNAHPTQPAVRALAPT